MSGTWQSLQSNESPMLISGTSLFMLEKTETNILCVCVVCVEGAVGGGGGGGVFL